MKRIMLSIFVVLALILNFCVALNVKAYEENAFTNGKCITNSNWQDSAMTGYKLDNETGTYELTGDEYSEENAGSVHVFYVVSDDGKLLYSFVPNYDTSMANTSIKEEIFNKGIVTTASCGATYVSYKTVIGNAPSEDSYLDFSDTDNNTEDGDSNTESNDGDTSADEVFDNEDDDQVVKKLAAPNTASPMTISILVISLALIGFAVYSFLKRTKPELFKRNSN